MHLLSRWAVNDSRNLGFDFASVVEAGEDCWADRELLKHRCEYSDWRFGFGFSLST